MEHVNVILYKKNGFRRFLISYSSACERPILKLVVHIDCGMANTMIIIAIRLEEDSTD